MLSGVRGSLVSGALCLLLTASQAAAQTASLVKDINTVPDASYDSGPYGFTEFNGAVYFFASSAPGDHGLWRTDGTPGGTQFVKADIAGAELLPLGDVLYLIADDGTRGVELWKSDGTTSGTVIVKDINPGAGDGLRFGLVDLNGTLYFQANDGVANFELWRSDGTEEGTVLVKDIHPSQSSIPFSFTVVGDTLFFAAADEASGRELWKSDGTPQGTVLVKDINPGLNSSDPFPMVNAGGVLLFRANDGINGNELWKSDGTPGGTVMVRDINPGLGSSSQDLSDSTLIEINGVVYFGANSGDSSGPGLWRSDGTLEGTERVTNELIPEAFQKVGDTLYFLRMDGPGVHATHHLWKSDGTAIGTQLVKTFEAVVEHHLAVVGSDVFFSVGSFLDDHELWRSDGTADGTVLLTNIGRRPDSGLTGIDDKLFLSAHTEETGSEPWSSDGTAAGSGMIKDIGVAPGGSVPTRIVAGNDTGSPFAQASGRIFFAATDGTRGVELWKTDGTEEGTTMVKDINPNVSFGVLSEEMINIGGSVLFAADDGVNGSELWKSDGTENGTVMVKNIHPVAGESSSPAYLVNLSGVLFFSATDGVNGYELWRSDGTQTGTVMVKDIAAGDLSSSPTALTTDGDRLFFIAYDGINGRALWTTDGTAARTAMVKDIHPVNDEDFYSELVSSGGLVYFRADVGEGNKLWRSDGTAAGTFAIHTISPTPHLFVPSWLTDVDGTLFFIQGDELWKSDGTEQGTTLVEDLDIVAVPLASPAGLTSSEGRLYFSALGVSGPELWRSDGTEVGTFVVKEFVGADFNFLGPSIIGQAAGALFLSVATTDGYQLWRSHGTSETTTAIPNEFLGSAGPLVPFGPNVLFTAASKEEGLELWSAPLLPAISSGGVVDAAGFRPTLAPGSLASVFGVELTTSTATAQSLPLPTSLAGVRVRVNGVDAPLLFVSPKQINFQVPAETPLGSNSVVTILGEQQSTSELTTVDAFAPGFFVNTATGGPIVQRHPDGALITAQNPAKPGDILILYATGIGGLDNPPANGAGASDSPLSMALILPTVTIGGVESTVMFAGLAPGFAGLGQINIRLPEALPQGSPLPLTIRFGDSASATLELPF